MRERPFRRLFALAERQAGNTGENLFRLLERRLDNVLFRMGLALSRRHARQAIAHGLIFVNGHKLDRASYLVEMNDTIAPRPKEKVVSLFKAVKESTKGRAVPSWLDVQPEPLEGKVTALPKADELAEGFEPQLIVEICAR
jgi:small subunit ribosomal protein S4